MSNLWSKNIAVLSMQHHHSLHLPVHLDKTTTESATVGKHYDILTFIRMTRMKNHLSRSFESQSQCWWPRCLSPVDWGKRPGCPEPSDCGCELEYPLVPGGRNKRKSPHWKQNSSLYVDLYAVLWIRSLFHSLSGQHTPASHLTATLGSVVGVSFWRHHEAVVIYHHITAMEGKLHFLCRDTGDKNTLKNEQWCHWPCIIAQLQWTDEL